ncbi:helix-turn-helix domain-containing protein [Helcococcus kunzii]|uniref:helix-turn-helix domain-containing protein n=1 Tax=Helcococcus kunzii TaxID=40091 RepID=UPI00389CFB74
MRTIGDTIKHLRIEAGLSQTQLGEKLHLSNQAISKWENNFSQPDINLLPEIANIFGVNIDDLFEYSVEKQYEKIGALLGNQKPLTNLEFERYEKFLLDQLTKDSKNYKANSMLGDLYISHAKMLRKKAVEYGKKALELKPNTKFDINTINNASGGAIYDWDVANHHELIDYYEKTLLIAPENKKLYFYLLDNLIDDKRLNDANRVLKESYIKNPDELNEYYTIFIKEIKHGFDSVKEEYKALAKKYNNDWRVLFAVANSLSKNECYEEAIPVWKQAFDVQEKPRFSDYYISIAHCYILLGDKKNAIKAYKNTLKLLKDEWNIKFGSFVDKINSKIDELSS